MTNESQLLSVTNSHGMLEYLGRPLRRSIKLYEGIAFIEEVRLESDDRIRYYVYRESSSVIFHHEYLESATCSIALRLLEDNSFLVLYADSTQQHYKAIYFVLSNSVLWKTPLRVQDYLLEPPD